MKKQRKQMILLLLALAVLIGGYFGLRYYNKNAAAETPVEEEEYVVEIEKDSIQRIVYLYDGVEYAFSKDGDGWIYEADPSLKIDPYYPNLMESRCEKIALVEKIENVTDMSQFGLDEIERFFSFETEDAAYTFYVGDRNPVSYGYYIKEPDSDTVYLVENLVVNVFSKTLDDVIAEEETEDAESSEITE